jgi:hypothetical protein
MKRTVATLATALTVAAVTAYAGPQFIIKDVKVGKGRETIIEPAPASPADAAAPDGATRLVGLQDDPKPGAPAVPPEGRAPVLVPAPAVVPACTPVCLTALDWQCGRYFTDELGRRWHLVDGPNWLEKPAQVAGTLVRTAAGRLVLIADSGRIYTTRLVVVP